jgi:hypothetical protein
MDEGLNEYLRIAEPHLQPALISPEALAYIRQIGCLLPAVSASGFECRLGEKEARADLGVRYLPSEGGAELLAGLPVDGYTLPRFLQREPAWERLRAFGAAWSEPDGHLHQEIEDIFLEFDVLGAPERAPIPAFFFDFKKTARRRLSTLEAALQLLWGETLAAPVRRRLFRCLDALPDGAVLYSVGAMFSRRLNGVRLYFHHLGSSAIPAYLDRVGWPGPLSDIEALLSWMPPGLTLCMDVGEAVLPKIGVQFHIDENLRSSTPKWADFLDGLVTRGLCLPAKRDALLAWVGHAHERSHRAAWPARLRRRGVAAHGDVLSVFLRMINHVKVSYQEGQPLEAKAYLGLVQTWLRHDAAARRPTLGDLEA